MKSQARIDFLIQKLALEPHPEGGFYREVYRSDQLLSDQRSTVTSIFYLLLKGQYSRWHRIDADEIWHFYEGDPCVLNIISQDLQEYHAHQLGFIEEETYPFQIVKPFEWQAARSLGDYSLLGCTVAPGFEFAKFEMLTKSHPEFHLIETRFSAAAEYF